MTVSPNSFYILSKGYNSGKPQKAPWPNCFVLSCNSAEETDKCYWLIYWLWKTRTFTPYLRGSVVWFIRIKDIRTIIEHARTQLERNASAFQSIIQRIQEVEQLKRLLERQLTASQQLENALLCRLSKCIELN